MNKQSQWLFEVPPALSGDRHAILYTNPEYYNDSEWESVLPISGGFQSILFQGDPDLLAVLHGRLRLGRPGNPQYPAPIKSQGTGVAKVQQALVKLGYLLPSSVDGKYGKQSYNTVLKYKRQYRILTETGYLDGIVGPKTIRHLDNTLAQREPEKVKPTVRIDVLADSLKSSRNRLSKFESPVGSGVIIQPTSIVIAIGQNVEVIATGDPLPSGSPAYTWSIADRENVQFVHLDNSQTHPNKVTITGKCVGKSQNQALSIVTKY
jgi:peptidoglycan hydrolase-like protein with peptidoglycan-binding domain